MIRSNKTDFRASKTMIPIAKKTPRTMVFPSPDAADSQDKQSWQSVLSAGLFILIHTSIGRMVSKSRSMSLSSLTVDSSSCKCPLDLLAFRI